jgi:hypothetical protein
MIFRKPYRRPSWGSIPNAKGHLKIESNCFRNLLRIKRNLCRGEGYFIRVLEVLRQTIALGSEIEIIERKVLIPPLEYALELKK